MRQTRSKVGHTLHLEKTINAPVAKCFACFGTTRALARWYDPSSRLTSFRPGGAVRASYFPSYEFIALIKNQLVAQGYTSVIDGVGMFSFVAQRGKTCVVFDHVAVGNKGREIPARTFHWQGLLENLAAVCEGSPVLFVGGCYPGKLPKGIRYRTCEEFVRSWRG